MPDVVELHALVVDDEQYVRDHLRDLLTSRAEVSEVLEASHGQEAIQTIHAEAPDLVFLDVKMPKTSGIEVIEEVGPDSMPATIFVTAYDEFAIEAFDLAAVDYLLKPFDEDRFARAFERGLRALKLSQVEDLALRFQNLLDVSGNRPVVPFGEEPRSENGNAPDADKEESDEYLKRLTVEVRGEIHVIPVEDIRYVTAEDIYVRIHTEEMSYLLRKRMYELEKRLDPTQFVRIHRSTIVRLDCIHRLVQRSGNDYSVQLDDTKTLSVSRSRKEELIRRLETGASS